VKKNYKISSRSFRSQEGQSLGSSMEKKLDEEHLGSQESTLVLRYSSETRASVTYPKLISVSSEMIQEDLSELFTSQLELITDRLWSTLMTEYFRELGMRITNTSDSVALASQGLLPVRTSTSMTIKDLRT
jgi:hypothetical protein